jgi:hypothetical protein
MLSFLAQFVPDFTQSAGSFQGQVDSTTVDAVLRPLMMGVSPVHMYSIVRMRAVRLTCRVGTTLPMRGGLCRKAALGLFYEEHVKTLSCGLPAILLVIVIICIHLHGLQDCP